LKRHTIITLAATLVCAATVHAQDNPLSTGIKSVYTIAKTNVLKSAEKMPEENYSFKPTPDVRSFGEVLGHVADAQYLFCGTVKGEEKKSDVAATKTSKADITAALKDAFAYCDGVYNSMKDEAAADKVKFFGADRPKLALLSFNAAHTMEHYGNIVTYMRLKGLVPPSSESSR